MRKDQREGDSLKRKIKKITENSIIPQAYSAVKLFHEKHGISAKDPMSKNWLVSQGVLSIRESYCSQGLQLSCPICLMEEHAGIAPKQAE